MNFEIWLKSIKIYTPSNKLCNLICALRLPHGGRNISQNKYTQFVRHIIISSTYSKNCPASNGSFDKFHYKSSKYLTAFPHSKPTHSPIKDVAQNKCCLDHG